MLDRHIRRAYSTAMNIAPCLSSDRMDWETPGSLFNLLHNEFSFTLDAAAQRPNRKTPDYFGPDHTDPSRRDCLLVADWPGTVWMNPPYGRRIGTFVEAAFARGGRGTNKAVVCLIPARTDTKFWHKYVMNASEVRLVVGRLRFVGAPAPAPFPSAVVVFHHPRSGFPRFRSMVVPK